jgi:hypothetical protein
VAKMREEKVQAAVVSRESSDEDDRVKFKRNREGNDEERTLNRAESKYFAASFRSEPNDDGSVITGPRDNQPIALVLRLGRITKLTENSDQSEPKRRRYSHGRSQLGRRLFRCCHAIETIIQLVEPGEIRSKTSTIVPLSCGRGATSTSSRVCVLVSIASRRDSEDCQTNAKGIPQQSAELSDQIPSVKIGSDGECTMKDTSCPVLTQVHTCDGDIATIIAKRVSYFTVQGVRKLRESTSTLQVRKNREGELRPVQVEVREKKCNGNHGRIKAVMLAKSDTTSGTTNSRGSRDKALDQRSGARSSKKHFSSEKRISDEWTKPHQRTETDAGDKITSDFYCEGEHREEPVLRAM